MGTALSRGSETTLGGTLIDAAAPVASHLVELRHRLIISIALLMVCAIGGYLAYNHILAFITKPFENLTGSLTDNDLNLHALGEGFSTRIRIAFLSGLAVSLPIHMFNVIGFFLPALKPRERRVLASVLIPSSILAVAGASYGYLVLAPIAVEFLTRSAFVPEGVGVLLSLRSSVTDLLRMIFGSAVALQLPVGIMVLLALRLVTRKSMVRASRHVVVIVLIVSAILTPPDVLSQLSLAAPLIALFFLSLVAARALHLGDE